MIKFLKLISLLTIILLNACSLSNSSYSKEKKSDEELAQIKLQLGVRYMELGRNEIAVKNLKEALELEPNSPEINGAVAVLYQELKMNSEADRYFQKALSLDENNYQTMNNYALFLCSKGEYSKGLSYAKKASDHPLNSRLWFSLTNAGRCEYRQGNMESAEKYYRAALSHNAQYAPALLKMYKISYHNNSFMSARAFLDRYVALVEHDADTLFYSYQIEKALGYHEKANESRQMLLDKFPFSDEAGKL